MAADLTLLHVDMKSKIDETYTQLRFYGYEFIPVFTLRNPWIQARLWRQSRSSEEIQKAYNKLVAGGAEFLAHILRDVGPQNGRWATNALPGLSWHNWKPAVAVDSVYKKDGKLLWGENDPGLTNEQKIDVRQAYFKYRDIGEALGLTCLDEIHDIGHMQLYSYEIPHKYSLAEVSKAMEVSWGPVEPK
jgi:hypothetical protein